jgi:CBS domain-containing protein
MLVSIGAFVASQGISGESHPMIAVNEIMSTARVTVGPTAFVGDLLALFDQNDFNAFPMLDERERLVGIVSKLDVLQLFLADHLSTPSGAEALGPARVAI